ncbi:hypothetical protein PRZ48_005287 [Zasmidium cellare]|uniref:FAD dependent oxidoreductase domain-containing protein n=1 Tax=Zasmidium cellare TaxID=395010 RepID=A0ABR0ET43_ZASCE|nr:hypothetical protein PRZ48_005287 [Zasmidium cellare]
MTGNYPRAQTNGHHDNDGPRPVTNATVPYWRTELHHLDEFRSTEELPEECDIAIIGAGMSGVSIAYNLLQLYGNEAKPSIALLEARQVCSGATGRNGGHAKLGNASQRKLIKEQGAQAADAYADFISDLMHGLKTVVEKEKLDCEFEVRRTFDVFLDENDAKEVSDLYHDSVAKGHRWTRDRDMVLADRVEQVTSIKGAKGALSGPACSLWPYKFVTQLLERIIDDVNLQTNTLVEAVSTESGSGRYLVKTPRGTLRAKKIIYASNGYTGGVLPSYKNKIVPYRGTASHLVPSPTPVSPHLSHTYNIVYGQKGTDYLNPRPDGSIVVGGANYRYKEHRDLWFNNWDDSQLIPNTESHFDGLMQRNFKGWETSGAFLERYWTGIMGCTVDGKPHIGRVPGQDGEQYVHAGFNGGGMTMIWSCSIGLARMVKEGISFGETGLPEMFEATAERLKAEW